MPVTKWWKATCTLRRPVVRCTRWSAFSRRAHRSRCQPGGQLHARSALAIERRCEGRARHPPRQVPADARRCAAAGDDSQVGGCVHGIRPQDLAEIAGAPRRDDPPPPVPGPVARRVRHLWHVAGRCRKRGLCPSCGARRMAETAAHRETTALSAGRAPRPLWPAARPRGAHRAAWHR